MSAIEKIMVPTDFGEAAEHAMNYVAGLTRGFPDKQVTFLHISDQVNDRTREEMERVHAQFELLSEASCKTEARVGDLTEEILAYHGEHPQDLVIMGTEGREGDLLSHSAEVALRADFPVLSIPRTIEPSGKIENIVLALDKNAINDSSSLGILHKLAREHDAKVHVLTIETEDEGHYIGSEASESVLEYYLETLDWKYVFPKNKSIEQGIIAYVEENNIDVLAVLPKNHASRTPRSEGQLTKLLTLHSKIPVLAID